MKGYLYKRIWEESSNKWGEEQILDPYPVCIDSMDDILTFMSPEYGIYKKCFASDTGCNTLFILKNEDEETIDYIFAIEKLPWED